MLRKTLVNYFKDVLGVHSLMITDELRVEVSNAGDSLKSAAASVNTGLASSVLEFFIDEKMKFNLSHLSKKVSYLVLHQKKNKSVFITETAGTLNKMIQALKLNPAEMLVLEFEGGTASSLKTELAQKIKWPCRVLILTEDQHSNDVETIGVHSFYTTYSPFAFLKEASLKKPAWDLMQKFVLK